MRTDRGTGLPILALLLTAALLVPATSFAQRRGPVRVPARRVVVIGIGGFGYPRYLFYDPWYDPYYGPWYDPYYAGQYPYPYPYPRPYPPGYYPGRLIDDRTASLRLDVKPRQAEVFVDGYLAGIVDDFDGIFQRLHVRPGEHELVLYLPGYRTAHQNLYLNPNSSQKINYTLVRLERGETMEPRPVPARPDEVGPTELRPPAPRQPYGPGPGQPYPPPGEAPANQSFGTFSLRVQPADAEVLVDGERWVTPEGQERLVIQLTDGKHRVEVRKEGFEKFTTDIQVKRGETVTLNVSLLRLSAAPF